MQDNLHSDLELDKIQIWFISRSIVASLKDYHISIVLSPKEAIEFLCEVFRLRNSRRRLYHCGLSIEPGACNDRRRIAHENQRDTSGDMHTLGAVMIKDGKAKLLNQWFE